MTALAAPLMPEAPTQHVIHSRVVGEIVVDEQDIYEFADGVFGFPEVTRFALLPTGRDGWLWLQSVEIGSLVFLLVDPFHYFENYVLDLPPSDCVRLRAEDPSRLLVYAIVTLPESSGDAPTANLQGPLVFDIAGRRGIQTVISEGTYTTREVVRIARLHG